MIRMTLPGVIDKSPDVIKGDTVLVFCNQKRFETMVTDVYGETVILNIDWIGMFQSIVSFCWYLLYQEAKRWPDVLLSYGKHLMQHAEKAVHYVLLLFIDFQISLRPADQALFTSLFWNGKRVQFNPIVCDVEFTVNRWHLNDLKYRKMVHKDAIV